MGTGIKQFRAAIESVLVSASAKPDAVVASLQLNPRVPLETVADYVKELNTPDGDFIFYIWIDTAAEPMSQMYLRCRFAMRADWIPPFLRCREEFSA